MSERLVLALDGSTRECSTALMRPHVLGGPHPGPGSLWDVVARRSYADARGQGRVLMRAVDEMLTEAGAGPGDVGAIVVGTGPGTFTGVRIAVATARALSLALAVPVTGVSSLSALMSTVAQEVQTDLVVPAIDARRGQVFYAVYRSLKAPEYRRWIRRAPPNVCDRGALAGIIKEPATVVVEDVELVGALPRGVEVVTAPIAAERLVFGQGLLIEPGEEPLGTRLTPWLIENLVAGSPAEPELVKPIYVRPPDADTHITKMKDPWADDAGRVTNGAEG
ncbi:MAG: tRNA (adenosine(37)-N6)-threonylcarbamoyltransferase complex dimerization subunit type 1 TsaB [Actinobacteria bacterium]|nr:tRNA (adenosine(37)-N6)-threonylcarbamoyltransferase complex dimerization subunit type 1 TsaB [Actinomycetota bacterium]